MLDVMAAPIIDRALYCGKEGAERETECALSVIITEQYLLVKPCVSPSGPRVYFTIATLHPPSCLEITCFLSNIIVSVLLFLTFKNLLNA